MAAGFTSPILLGGGQIQPAQKRKRSHEEVPPVGSRAGFRPCCLAADHRRQQRGRSSGGEEASPPSSSSPQAPQEASPPSSPPSPQEGGSQEGLSRLTCPMGRLALESSPRPPSHWVLPGETWRDEDRIRWRPCARRRAANEGRKAEAAQRLRVCCRTPRVSQCVAENPLGWRREREHYRDQDQQRSHPFEVPRDLQQPRLLT